MHGLQYALVTQVPVAADKDYTTGSGGVGTITSCVWRCCSSPLRTSAGGAYDNNDIRHYNTNGTMKLKLTAFLSACYMYYTVARR